MTGFAAAWAILEGVIGVRLRQRYEIAQIVWCRYAVHLLIVFAIWGWHQPARIWSTTRRKLHVSRSLLMLVMPISFGLALREGMPANAVWSVMWLAPLMIVALALGLGRERPGWLSWAAAAAGSVGAVLVLAPAAAGSGRAILWSLLMGASFALYVVLTRDLRDELVRTNLFYTAIGVFLALTPFVPGMWIAPDARDAAILGAIGAVGFVALVALDRAVERASVSATAPFIHLQVVFVALIEWRRHPSLPPAHVIAGTMAIAALALLCWRQAAQLALVPRRAPVP
jgi:drug/metabolite transporter (DMT)-like permease